jgi:hypothetical protein
MQPILWGYWCGLVFAWQGKPELLITSAKLTRGLHYKHIMTIVSGNCGAPTRHDIQHNDTQHNDTQLTTLSIKTISIMTLSITIKNVTLSITTLGIWHSILLYRVSYKLSVVYTECHKRTYYAERHYAECKWRLYYNSGVGLALVSARVTITIL